MKGKIENSACVNDIAGALFKGLYLNDAIIIIYNKCECKLLTSKVFMCNHSSSLIKISIYFLNVMSAFFASLPVANYSRSQSVQKYANLFCICMAITTHFKLLLWANILDGIEPKLHD